MDKLELICELIITVAGVIPTLVSLVLLIKNTIAQKNWELIMKIAQAAMSEVETYSAEHPDMTSDDKLNMALEVISAGCTAAGIDLDVELLKQIKAYIEEMCKWSKTVNVKA